MDNNAIKPFLRLLTAMDAGNVFTLKQVNLFYPLKLKDIKQHYSGYITIIDREIVKSRAPTLKMILSGVPSRLLALDGEKNKETIDLRTKFFSFTEKAFIEAQKYLEENVFSNGSNISVRKFYPIDKDSIVTEFARMTLFIASLFGESFRLITEQSTIEHILWGIPFRKDRIVIPNALLINKNKESLLLFMAKGVGENLMFTSQDIRDAGFKTAVWPINIGVFRSKRYGEFIKAFDFIVTFQVNKTADPVIIDTNTLRIHTGPLYKEGEK